jgi:tetratricopeptide (TPR) repeat protein
LLDVGRFEDVLKSLDGYETKYSKQSAFYPSVDLYRVRALVGLKRFADAETLVSKMASQYANDSATTNAYAEIAKGFYAAFDAIKEDTAEKKALERKTADYFALHNERTGFASFTNLKNVALWYADLGELKLAEDNFRRLFDKFGKNPAQQKELRDVKHAFAATLNRGDKFAEAEPLWRDVYAFKPKDRGVVREFARCLGGYLREEGNVYKEITGVGKYSEARELDVKLLKGIEDAGEKNSPDYWQARVDYFFHLSMEGRQDPNAKQQALALFKNWDALNPDLGGEKTAKMLRRLNAENQR